jgi:hypothetical protein
MEPIDPNNDFFSPKVRNRVRTAIVLALVPMACLGFSYLGAYAFTGALVSNGLIPPWPADEDPRPRNVLLLFCGLMTLFTLAAAAFRLISAHQLHRIDAIAEEA